MNFVILAILVLCHKMVITDDECSGFYTSLERSCSTFLKTVAPSKLCHYYNNKCIEWYNDCSQYPPTGATFDDNICKTISPSDPKKKCDPQTESGIKVCKEVDKECNDLTKEQCLTVTLALNEGERCVLINDQCELHYDDCTNAALKNEAICTKNIPSSNAKRCKWTGSSCSLDDRKCNNFIEYSDSKGSNLPCHSLAHDAQKICYYNKNQCIETYAECEKYTGTDSTTCQNIIPLKKAIDADEGSYAPDPLNKCEMELEQCTEKPRVCTDYKKRNDDADTLCTQLKSEKDSTNGKAHCILSGEDCKDVYSSCENYNLLVTNENDRDENECKSIPTDDHYKCIFENKQCKREKKKCEEIIKDTVCTYHTLDDDKKKCIFKSNSCKEEFKNCDSYNGYHSSDPTNIEKNVCEAITPLYDRDLSKYKCVYKDTDGTKTCEKKLK